MKEVRPGAAETGARPLETTLEARLTGLPRPAMPPDMEERIRARLRAGAAPAPSPAPRIGPLPLLAHKYGLTPAQQWAFLAVLLTLAIGFLTRQSIVFSFANGSCERDATTPVSTALLPRGVAPRASSSTRPCADCHGEKKM